MQCYCCCCCCCYCRRRNRQIRRDHIYSLLLLWTHNNNFHFHCNFVYFFLCDCYSNSRYIFFSGLCFVKKNKQTPKQIKVIVCLLLDSQLRRRRWRQRCNDDDDDDLMDPTTKYLATKMVNEWMNECFVIVCVWVRNDRIKKWRREREKSLDVYVVVVVVVYIGQVFFLIFFLNCSHVVCCCIQRRRRLRRLWNMNPTFRNTHTHSEYIIIIIDILQESLNTRYTHIYHWWSSLNDDDDNDWGKKIDQSNQNEKRTPFTSVIIQVYD